MTITATSTQTTLTNEIQIKSITLDDDEVIDFTAYVDSLTDINANLTMSISNESLINEYLTYAWTTSAGSLSDATISNPVLTTPTTAQTVVVGLTVDDGIETDIDTRSIVVSDNSTLQTIWVDRINPQVSFTDA